MSAKDKKNEKAVTNQPVTQPVAAAPVAVPPAVAAKPRKTPKYITQAEEAYKLLLQGSVTQDQLRAINEAYPGDAIGYAKKVYQIEVYSRKVAGMTTYSLVPIPAATPATPAAKADDGNGHGNGKELAGAEEEGDEVEMEEEEGEGSAA
jgi:hypothetical protein